MVELLGVAVVSASLWAGNTALIRVLLLNTLVLYLAFMVRDVGRACRLCGVF